MRILAVGPMWRGSNAGGLFRALSRHGCLIDIVDEFYAISLQSKNKSLKVLERVIRPLQVKEYNNIIEQKITLFQPDVVLVYKGAFVWPQTLKFAQKRGCKLVLFYPDVSTTAHGTNIPACIPLYDLVLTTKTFGIKDMQLKYGVEKTHFVPHGFDPEIHRTLEVTAGDIENFGCDASFIGTWSPKKEKWLIKLKEGCPDIKLKIWGDQWFKASAPILKSNIQGKAVLGDMYAIAIQCSKINLGILSEQRIGSSSGDLITSRTFHIPGAGGFLLHERNEESILYFKEDVEAGFFDGPAEMVEKVKIFLNNSDLRETIRLGGYERAVKEHSLDQRAIKIIEYVKNLCSSR